jgi:hypothetical protein
MMPRLSPPELRIIRSMLSREFGPSTPQLDLIESLSYDTRHMTGTGYYVTFADAKHLPRLDLLNIELSEDLRTSLPPPADLVAFTLFVRSGYFSSFEGYTFGDVRWPIEPMENWLLFDADEKRLAETPLHAVKATPKAATPITTGAERRKLEGQLREQLHQDCDEARRIGYNPALFLVMMSKHGPVEACQQVIMSSKIPDGFMRLLELKRLELTAEATILRGSWRTLFSESVLEQARSRLIAYGRKDLAIRH